jgi:hypothetical protein
MPRRSRPDPPDGWITRKALADAVPDVSDRNLLNWCGMGLLERPRRGVGFWRAESVPQIHKLKELQQQNPGNADPWFWGLWLDPADYSVPGMRSRILQHLDHALEAIRNAPDEIEPSVDCALKHPRLTSKLRRRGIDTSELRDAMLWAYRVAADIEQHERLDNPDSRVFATLRKIGSIPGKGFTPPDRKLGIDSMSIAWLRSVIETPDAFEQLRRDCRAIDHLAALARNIDWRAVDPIIQRAIQSVLGNRQPVPPSIRARKEMRKRPPIPDIVRFLLDVWDDHDYRAGLIAGLNAIRLSPDHSKRLTEILGLATWCGELALQYCQSLKT